MPREAVTLRGALALGAATLLLALVVLALSWQQGVLPAISTGAWLAIGLVLGLLVSLEWRFIRDYRRARRPSQRLER